MIVNYKQFPVPCSLVSSSRAATQPSRVGNSKYLIADWLSASDGGTCEGARGHLLPQQGLRGSRHHSHIPRGLLPLATSWETQLAGAVPGYPVSQHVSPLLSDSVTHRYSKRMGTSLNSHSLNLSPLRHACASTRAAELKEASPDLRMPALAAGRAAETCAIM